MANVYTQDDIPALLKRTRQVFQKRIFYTATLSTRRIFFSFSPLVLVNFFRHQITDVDVAVVAAAAAAAVAAAAAPDQPPPVPP